ncbi:hypothetical protein E9840_01150 [Tissierella creatinini]|nr:hypothetical protein E9840_01150 [Tissierella creatinini]TJX60639.1 hypothetical protein E8P77_19955 [Soehngenia saccharolytica]
MDNSLSKSREAAAKKIEKYKNNVNKNPELAARKAAHEEGGKIGMEVLKQMGYGEGKLSPAEAEAILNEMGTNSEDIMKLLADEVEIINRLIVGGKK